MKKLKNELKMWLAEKLLGWSFVVAPKNKEGNKIKEMVLKYASDKLIELTKGQ